MPQFCFALKLTSFNSHFPQWQLCNIIDSDGKGTAPNNIELSDEQWQEFKYECLKAEFSPNHNPVLKVVSIIGFEFNFFCSSHRIAFFSRGEFAHG